MSLRQRALHIHKRALCIRKRALYVTYESCHMSLAVYESCHVCVMPLVHTYIHAHAHAHAHAHIESHAIPDVSAPAVKIDDDTAVLLQCLIWVMPHMGHATYGSFHSYAHTYTHTHTHTHTHIYDSQVIYLTCLHQQ